MSNKSVKRDREDQGNVSNKTPITAQDSSDEEETIADEDDITQEGFPMDEEQEPLVDWDDFDAALQDSKVSFYKDEWIHKTSSGLLEQIKNKTPITFQQFDVDYYVSNYEKGAIVRMFGVDEDGNSITLNLHGFDPYIYVVLDEELSRYGPDQFQKMLEEELNEAEQKRSRHYKMVKKVAPNHKDRKVKQDDIDWIRKIEYMEKFIFRVYSLKPSPVYKIWVGLPGYVPTIRKHLENRDKDEWGDIPERCWGYSSLLTCESDKPFTLRCTADINVKGSSWVEFCNYKEKRASTHCNAEFSIHYKDIKQIPQEGKYAKSAPFRMISFDIECASINDRFPKPEESPVACISCGVVVHGNEVTGKKVNTIFKVLFMFGGCDPIDGTIIYSFEKEEDMILAFRDFCTTINPMGWTGFNLGFDMPYLLDRSQALGIFEEFRLLDKVHGHGCFVKKETTTSKQRGTRVLKRVETKGRVYLDPFVIISIEMKLPSYTLNYISKLLLDDQKADIPKTKITKLHKGTNTDRRRLGFYCEKDMLLPIRILVKTMFHIQTIQLSRITGVPLGSVYERGQMSRIVSQILRRLTTTDYIIPTLPLREKEEIKGALVIETAAKYYGPTEPIAVLDFASLYPTIIIAYNLCYTTLLDEVTIKKMEFKEVEDYNKLIITDLKDGPVTTYFITPKHKKGIIPEILENLLAERKVAKGKMFSYSAEGKTPDKAFEIIWDRIQLCLKISANSVYGFTGAPFGGYEPKIANTVTAHGRRLNRFSQKWVLDNYPGSKIIAGDTDSIMIRLCVDGKMIDNVADTFKWGPGVASGITTAIGMKPISLLLEKIGCPSLFDKKKRYAIQYWEKPDAPLKVYTVGLENKSRGCAGVLRDCLDKSLYYMLWKGDPNLAIEYVKKMIGLIYSNEIDISKLVITKQLSKPMKEYKTKQVHVECIKRKMEKDKFYIPEVGDRIPYVMVDRGKFSFARRGAAVTKQKVNKSEKSMDPMHALDGKIKIDVEYYIETQLKKPLAKIFVPLLGSIDVMIKTLFEGSHTRKRVQEEPVQKTGMLSFATVRTRRCLFCNVLLTGKETGVCDDCQKNKYIVVEELQTKEIQLREESQQLWDKCLECGPYVSIEEAELDCTEMDCSQFFRRKTVNFDIKKIEEKLKQLSI